MTPEQLADQLTTPLLRNMTGRERIYATTEGLSTGEVALLRMAEALHSVQALAPRVDSALQAAVADCCRSIADDIEGLPR